MPNTKNTELVRETTAEINASSGLVLVDYKGLTHRKLETLRNLLEESGAQLKIIKNTLLKISIQSSAHKTDTDLADIPGPTATILLPGDIVTPIKKLVEFIKQNELPSVKMGILNHQVVDTLYITRVAKLPSYEQLLAQVLQRIQGPSYGLLYALVGKQRELLYGLKAIEKLKGGEQNG